MHSKLFPFSLPLSPARGPADRHLRRRDALHRPVRPRPPHGGGHGDAAQERDGLAGILNFIFICVGNLGCLNFENVRMAGKTCSSRLDRTLNSIFFLLFALSKRREKNILS